MARDVAARLDRSLDAFEPERVSAVAVKAFFNLAREWALGRDARIVLLGSPSVRTYYRWRAGQVAALPRDTLERISVLLGIYKALHILFPTAERANAWLRRPNEAFGGETALDVMLKGRVDHLYRVRRYLDSWRG
jgi:uncharacterized protein (DUF2384 family)